MQDTKVKFKVLRKRLVKILTTSPYNFSISHTKKKDKISNKFWEEKGNGLYHSVNGADFTKPTSKTTTSQRILSR